MKFKSFPGKLSTALLASKFNFLIIVKQKMDEGSLSEAKGLRNGSLLLSHERNFISIIRIGIGVELNADIGCYAQ